MTTQLKFTIYYAPCIVRSYAVEKIGDNAVSKERSKYSNRAISNSNKVVVVFGVV